MANIFISYARSYEAFARQLAEGLSKAGADIWLDVEDIPAGMNWSTAIQDGLDRSDVLLVVVTPESMGSRNVENEWQYFLDEQKPVIPVLLQRPDRIHFQLRRLQWINFQDQPFDAAFGQLIAELRRKGLQLAMPPGAERARPTHTPPPGDPVIGMPPVTADAARQTMVGGQRPPLPTPARRTNNRGPLMLALIALLVFGLAGGVGIVVWINNANRTASTATPGADFFTPTIDRLTTQAAGDGNPIGGGGTEVAATDDPQLSQFNGALHFEFADVGGATEAVRVWSNYSLLIDMEGFSLRDESGSTYLFPPVELVPQGFVDIVTGTAAEAAPNVLSWGLPNPIYEPGETVVLLDATQRIAVASTVPENQPDETPAAAALTIGGRAIVSTSGNDALRMRAEASTSAEVVVSMPSGTRVDIINGPVEAEGFNWWQVRDASGREGWAVDFADDEQTLIPLPPGY